MPAKPAKQKKISHLMVGNIGLFHVCYRLSCRGWNVLPTSRNARGVDVIIYSQDAQRKHTIQVKTLSSQNAVPFGTNRDNLFADFFVVCVRTVAPNSGADEPNPECFVLRKEELLNGISAWGKGKKKSYWLERKDYEHDAFRERWDKIGHGIIP